MIHSMPGHETSNYEKVLQVVFRWPAGQRFALVQEVLKTLAPEIAMLSESGQTRQQTLALAQGLLVTNRPAPSDAEVAQWLDEHRTEKYS